MSNFVPHAEDILRIKLAAIAVDARESVEPGFRERLASSAGMTKQANIPIGPFLQGLGRYLVPLLGVVAAIDIIKQISDGAKNAQEKRDGVPGGGQHGVPPAFRDISRSGPETDLKWQGRYSDEPQTIVTDPELLKGDPTLDPSYYDEFKGRYQDALSNQGLRGFGTQPGSYGGSVPAARDLEDSFRSSTPVVGKPRTSETTRKLRRIEAAAPTPFAQDSGLKPTNAEGIPSVIRDVVGLEQSQEQLASRGFGMATKESPFYDPSHTMGRSTEQGAFTSLPGRDLQTTKLYESQAWREGGGVVQDTAMKIDWQLQNQILEPLRNGIITPEVAEREVAMLVEQVKYYHPEEADAIIEASSLGELSGFRGGLAPAGREGYRLDKFDPEAISAWKPSPAGEYGLSPWTQEQTRRMGEEFAPYVGQGRAEVGRNLRRMPGRALVPGEQFAPGE